MPARVSARADTTRAATKIAASLILTLALSAVSYPDAAGAVPAPSPRFGTTDLRAAGIDVGPLIFEQNRGQTDSRARFVARAGGAQLFFTDDELVWSLGRGCSPTVSMLPSPLPDAPSRCEEERDWTVITSIVGSLPGTWLGEDPRQAQVHYLINDEHGGASFSSVPTFGRLRRPEVLPGIDLLFYGRAGRLEFDFVVRPGSDPASIRLRFRGASELSLDGEGNLVLRRDRRSLVHRVPMLYQESDGARIEVAGSWQILAPGLAGFRVARYDRRLPLVIDPVVLFSTHHGGMSEDQIRDVAVDRNGDVYVTGFTRALDFPLADPLQPARAGGSADAFVSKLENDGTELVFSTYFGGSGDDLGTGIALDGSDVVVALTTSSPDLPTTSQIQPNYAGGRFDCAVMKIGGQGGRLDFSTYLGGSGFDFSSRVAVDGDGSIVVTGASASADFPLADPVQAMNAGDFDVVLSRIDPVHDLLTFSTYLGGSTLDQAFALALDSGGRVVVAGATQSSDFPTERALQAAPGGALDGILAVFDDDRLSSSTYLGGSGLDLVAGVADAGGVFVTGWTSSLDFPVDSALQPALAGGFDAFVARLTSLGGGPRLQFSTYFGASAEDLGLDIDVRGGRIVVTGRTSSVDFPTTAPLQSYGGGPSDVVLFEMSTNGARVPFSTFLGGAGADQIESGIRLDWLHNAILAGWTGSPDFPTTPGARQPVAAGGVDGFVLKVAIPSAEEKLELVEDRIGELKHSGGVSRGAAAFLLAKIRIARFFLERGRPEKARFFLERLLRDLESHPLLRHLPEAVLGEVTFAIEDILAQIELEEST